ncbi:hypothetical protein KKA47_06265 [bacterium]|nr:hypothetical protein [bacterium]
MVIRICDPGNVAYGSRVQAHPAAAAPSSVDQLSIAAKLGICIIKFSKLLQGESSLSKFN